MSTIWLAQNFLNSGSKATEDAGSSRGIVSAISTVQNVRSAIDSEIQNVRSAIETRFKGVPSPKIPQEDSREREQPLPPRRKEQGLPPRSRPQPIMGPPSADRQKQQYPAGTADPRFAHYDYRIPDSRSQHRGNPRDRRYGYHPSGVPPSRYDDRAPRSALPPGYGNSPRPLQPQWSTEKTPTSPYHPRQPPPRSPHPAQVPHTAHPGGAFPRYDSSARKEISLPVQGVTPGKDSQASGKDKCGFFDAFIKCKSKPALSPNPAAPNSAGPPEFDSEGAFDSPLLSPIPPPQEKVPVYMGTREHGYYEYRTPGAQTEFDSVPLHTGGTPRTQHDRSLPPDWAAPPLPNGHQQYREQEEDLKVSEEEIQPLTLKEKLIDFIIRLRLWIRRQLKRRPSRIPSLHGDAEAQALDEIEKELREAFVLSWCTLVGAWIVQFTTFGYIWSWGVFQDYLLNHYAEAHPSAKKVAWIGSLQLMMVFALGIVSGRLFDAGKFQWAMMGGSLIFAMGCFTLSFVDPTNFMQLFLVQGLFMGTGLGLVFVPSCLIVQLHFHDRKALMSGIVMSGSSFGALMYPVMLDKLLPSRGFNGGVRGTAYMVVALLVIANCLMTVPPKKWAPKFPPPNLIEYFKDIHYAAACGTLFLVFLTMWFPQYWLEEFAVRHGVEPHLSFYSLAVIAAGGMIGRPALGWAADRYGPWTMLLPTTFLLMLMICLVSVVKNAVALIFVSLFYGIASHGWLSLVVYALSSLAARPGELGHRTGFALSVGSLGAFLGGSAQAALLSDKWIWARPIGLFAFILILAIGLMGYVRHLMTLKRRTVYV